MDFVIPDKPKPIVKIKKLTRRGWFEMGVSAVIFSAIVSAPPILLSADVRSSSMAKWLYIAWGIVFILAMFVTLIEIMKREVKEVVVS